MRPIDADELAKEIESFSCWVTAWNEYPELAREIVLQMKKSTAELVREAPTVEAVPKGEKIEENGIQIRRTVFCGDCKWSYDAGKAGFYCNHPDNLYTIACRPFDYCDEGERRKKRKMTEAELRADEKIVCRNATVIADSNGNLAWIDNEKAEISLSAKEKKK